MSSFLINAAHLSTYFDIAIIIIVVGAAAAAAVRLCWLPMLRARFQHLLLFSVDPFLSTYRQNTYNFVFRLMHFNHRPEINTKMESRKKRRQRQHVLCHFFMILQSKFHIFIFFFVVVVALLLLRSSLFWFVSAFL